MFEGLAGLDVVRDSGVMNNRTKDWVITLRSQRGHSIKVVAHDDGYKNQSYVRASLWSDSSGWNVIVSRSGDELTLGGTLEAWASNMGSEIDDVTLEACTLLGLME